MTRAKRVAVVLAVAMTAGASAAQAHQGNPNFRSIIHDGRLAPGVTVQVLGYDNQLELFNTGGGPVTVYGYNGEPYARVLADGTVEVNRRSPATYLNEDRYGTTPVPAFANHGGPPQWQVQDKTHRFIWHDHRIHWMATGTPPQVKDKGKKTKIFDYSIPIVVGSTRTAVHGTLFWVGSPAGFPVAAAVSLMLIAVVAIAVVVVVRRRRDPARVAGPVEEAW
jgi:hypothetical protein